MNHMASCSFNIESLPHDCVSEILSHTSPLVACIVSLVSPSLCSCANSDTVWRSFLPSDYEDIVSRAVNPFTLSFSSYKQLFHALCHPLLIDQGNKVRTPSSISFNSLFHALILIKSSLLISIF